MGKNLLVACGALLWALSGWQGQAWAQEREIIENIEVRGTRRVPQETVKFHVLSKPNDFLDPALLRRDFRTVWETGYFDDVKIELEDGDRGKIVIFWVTERPMIRSIEYEGLKSATQTEVLEKYQEEKVGVGIETPFDPTKIQRAIVVLTDLLAEKGRQYAEISYKTEDVPPNSKLLTFVIEEGPKVKVEKINFHGNSVYSDKELRKSMKFIKETGLISFFTGKSKYEMRRLEGSLELGVRAKYHEKGHIKLLIKEPRVEVRDVKRWSWFPIPFRRKTAKRVFIDVDLEENDQYRVGDLQFTGNTLFEDRILLRVLGMKEGEVFNGELIREGFENLKKIYGSRGYINWTPIPRQEVDEVDKVVNVVFDFEEGKQYFLRRMDFVGNTTTRDKVIRREILVHEGGIFNTQLWDVSVLRLNQLGYFDQLKAEEDAEIKPDETAGDDETGQVDVVLKVKEKGKNSVSFSGGTSGFGGSFIGAGYSTNNFMGHGESISIQAQGGTRASQYVFSFTEPYFRDRPLTTGFTVFHRRYSFHEADTLGFFSGLVPLGSELFSQNSTGFTTFASYPVRPFTHFGMSYGLDKSSTGFSSDDNQSFFSALWPADRFSGRTAFEGLVRSTVTPSLTYNTVDNPFQPTRGKSLSLFLQFTGGPVLRGGANIVRPTVEAKWFKPVNKGRNTIGMRGLFSFVSGFDGLQPPVFDRQFIGGEDSIRGFDIRLISPLALTTFERTETVPVLNPDGTPQIDPLTGQNLVRREPRYYSSFQFVGGDTQVVYNLEYRIPIMGPVTLAPFFDIGRSWVMRRAALTIADNSTAGLVVLEDGAFRPVRAGEEVQVIPGTDKWRASTGVELQIIMPVVNAPFRLIFGYNPLRFNEFVPNPTGAASIPIIFEKRSDVKFSVGRTF